MVTIKWAWLRSLAMHNHSFGAEMWQKTSLAWFYGIVTAYKIISITESIVRHKPVFYPTKLLLLIQMIALRSNSPN